MRSRSRSVTPEKTDSHNDRYKHMLNKIEESVGGLVRKTTLLSSTFIK